MNDTSPLSLAVDLGLNGSSPAALAGNVLSEVADRTRIMLYLVTPNETIFERVEQVPNYFIKFIPFMPLILVPELIFLFLQRKKTPNFGETICSLMCGVLLFFPGAVFGQIELHMYTWLYNRYNIIDLAYDSYLTWFLCLLFTDLGSFAWHKAAHEINFIWAFHQVHHSSQDFNVSIAMRLPTFNRYIAMMFVMPLALVFPPSVFYVHYQLNYLFQLWIHSNVIPSWGWMDYVFNNPSVHRVHHARNRYCIDKNYATVFMIWDILFGTFQQEKKDEQLYYGLVHSVKSFDVFYLQIHHFKDIARRLKEMTTIGDKISVFVKGPGWAPGKPRLGNIEEIDEVPVDKSEYNTHLPLWVRPYLAVHTVIIFFLYYRMKDTGLVSRNLTIIQGLFVLASIGSVGYMLEKKRFSPLLEMTRCAAFFVVEVFLHDMLFASVTVGYAIRTVFIVSTVIWTLRNILQLGPAGKTSKVD